MEDQDGQAVAALVRAYYRALETGAPLAPFYATDEEAGPLGPVVKIGSGAGEVFHGWDAVAAEVARVGAALTANRLESRALTVRRQGDLGWFSDLVWWSGVAAGPDGGGTPGQPFASLTRWTGVCLRLPGGWRFLQLHVSEEV